jgi:hypothetical protein
MDGFTAARKTPFQIRLRRINKLYFMDNPG